MTSRKIGNAATAWASSLKRVGVQLLFLAAMVHGAAGQTTSDPAKSNNVENLVVTAEKRASTVQSAPLSITALSGKQLQAQGITTINQIVEAVPGISMRTSGPGQTELEMRGMSSSGGAAPTVGFYLDETPLSPPAGSFNGKVVIDPDLFDLNRVEVLRGPQGTLYGSGSMGGTIKLLTNQPDLAKYTGDIDTTLSGTVGGGANPTGKFMVNIPIVPDKLALRVVGTEQYVSGWIDRIIDTPFPLPTNPGPACPGWNGCVRGNVQAAPSQQTKPDVNWELQQGARASLLFKPNEDLSIQTNFMFQGTTMGGNNDYDLPPGSSVLAHYQPFNVAEPFSDAFRLYSTTIDYDLGFATLTSATSYWSRDEKQTQDSSEGIFSLSGYYGFDDIGYTPVGFTENDLSHQFSEEIRLASANTGRFSWVLGGFYSQFESILQDTNGAPGLAYLSVGGQAANPNGIFYDATQPYHITQYAGFGEASYKITDHWKATVGLRYFSYDTNVTEQQSGIATVSGNAGVTSASYRTAASGFTPKFNVSYEPDRDLTVYATASKGFRPGGVNVPIPADIGCVIEKETYAPDSSWDYELGEKARLAHGRIQLNTDFYYIAWSNVQQLIEQACGYPLSENAGNATSYGPEAELTARLTDALTFAISATYTHATLTSVNALLTQADPALHSGTPILNIPKYTESASLTYRAPLSDTYDFVARIANTYTGPSTDISYTYEQLEPYDLIGIRTGVVGPHWSGYFFIDNLTNKHAELSTNITSLAWTIPSVTRVSTNQPLTIGINLAYRF